MKQPKFTVLTSTRNGLPFVGQCIRSVLNQSYDNWEMIIGDDASFDRTYERACEISSKHSNITVIKNKKRLYCGANYKHLLSQATGDICGVLDGDDVLPHDSIKTIVGYYMEHPDIDFIWTNHLWFNKDMSRHRKGISSGPKKGTIFDTEKGLLHVYSHWRTFRTKLKDSGSLFNPSLKCSVDKDLGYTLEERGKGAFLNQPLYHYRYHPANMSHNSVQKQVWRKIRKLHLNKKRYESIELK